MSNINGTTACEINKVSFVEFDFGSGIPFTTLQMQCDDNNEGTVQVNGVDITSQLPTGSFTNTTITGVTSPLKKIRLDAVNANASSVYLGSITIDGVMLKDPLTVIGDAKATNFNPITDDINTIRGQETGYATLNSLVLTGGATLSNGNLDILGSTAYRTTPSTIGIKSGKYYWEYSLTHFNGGSTDCHLGICLDNFTDFRDTWVLSTNYGWGYTCQGGLGYHGNSQSNLGSSARTTGDTIAFSFDADVGELYIYVNGSIINSGNPAFTGLTNGPYYPFVSTGTSASDVSCNFGQKPFKFPPPDGFQPLNLSIVQPEKVVARPDQYVGTVLYNGDGGTSNTVTGLSFKPDFVWGKCRTGDTLPHNLFDVVRGFDKQLNANETAAEVDRAGDAVTPLSNGFILDATYCNINNGSTTNVAWCWKAGGNKNTFNIDDVGYANASDVNMNVGGLTSSVYNQGSTNYTTSQVTGNDYSWSSSATNGMFNGQRNTIRAASSQNTFTWTTSIALTTLRLMVHKEGGTTTIKITDDNGTRDIASLFPATSNSDVTNGNLTFVNVPVSGTLTKIEVNADPSGVGYRKRHCNG